MILESQKAVRNAGWLMLQQGVLLVGNALFAAFVPRLLGPDTYGKFALLLSVLMWFALSSGLGLGRVVTRYVPALYFSSDREALRALFWSLLAVRVISGTVMAALCLGVTVLWLRDVDITVLLLISANVLLLTLTDIVYVLFLSFNQAARAGLGAVLGIWLQVVLLPLGFWLSGLAGACGGLLLAQCIILGLGLRWALPDVSRPILRLEKGYLAPYLRFGAMFFVAGLVSATSGLIGAPLMKAMSAGYAEIGYFGLATSVYTTLFMLFPVLLQAFTPLFVLFAERGRPAELIQWVELLLKWSTVLGVAIVFSVLLLGPDLVPLILGSAYRPVAVDLLPLMLAILFAPLGSLAQVLCLVQERPGLVLQTSLVQLGAFLASAPLLIAWRGSLGACLALAFALVAASTYSTRGVRQRMRYSLRLWAGSILLGAVFLPVVSFRSAWPANAGLYGAFLLGYACLLLAARIVAPSEMAAAWAFLRTRSVGAR